MCLSKSVAVAKNSELAVMAVQSEQVSQHPMIQAVPPTASPADAAAHASPKDARHPLVLALIESTKPGITRMVTITACVGFAIAVLGRLVGVGDAGTRVATIGAMGVAAIGCLVGTALAASGANALNQWMERDRDALMERTANRPIPSGRASANQVLLLGGVLCIAGCGVLFGVCGLVPATIAAATILTYLSIYTVLKPVTPWSTLIGAFPGALPPMIGCSAGLIAVTNELGTGLGSPWQTLADPLGLSLFAILFAWQMPHFHAIGVMYASDYARGGHRILAVVDPTGRRAAASMVLWSIALVGVSVVPTILRPDIAALAYLPLAIVAGAVFVRACLRFARTLSVKDARTAFLASVMYLPVLLLVLTIEAMVRVLLL